MRQECQKMFLFSYLNFMHIGKIMYFDNLQNFLSACKSYFVSKKSIQFYVVLLVYLHKQWKCEIKFCTRFIFFRFYSSFLHYPRNNCLKVKILVSCLNHEKLVILFPICLIIYRVE